MLAVVPALLVGPFDLFDVPWWIWPLLAVVLVAYVTVVPTWRYRVHRWEVTDTAVYTQTGWWSRERRIAPMSRIQTVDHAEGAIARLFGLATVTVTTASAAGALEIAGLDKDVARATGRRADDQGGRRGGRRHVIEPDLSAYPPPEPGPEMRRDAEWQRLDPRMLLVHPIREVIRFLPVLIGLRRWPGPRPEGEQWQLLGVADPDRARPAALPDHELPDQRRPHRAASAGCSTGTCCRRRLDRVRTVDLTSSLIHRLLGLTKVRIGTGTASTSDEDRIDLDGLPLDRARALRAELLRTSTADDEVADRGRRRSGTS